MRELIFCCRYCFYVDATGVLVGSEATVAEIQHFPLLVQCKRCDKYNCVPVNHTMISSLFEKSGIFKRVSGDEAG